MSANVLNFIWKTTNLHNFDYVTPLEMQGCFLKPKKINLNYLKTFAKEKSFPL